MADPLARSPIAVDPPEVVVSGWLVSGRIARAALTITDCTPLAKVSVKAPYDGELAGELGVPFGRAARQDWDGIEVLLIGSGPGEWLALGPPGTGSRLAGAVVPPAGELVSVVDLTHGRALVRLTGTRSAELLAKECALDLGDDGTALRTAVAGLATDVVRDDRSGVRSYLLHCERSSGRYLYDVLLDAGTDLGIEPDGFRRSAHTETV